MILLVGGTSCVLWNVVDTEVKGFARGPWARARRLEKSGILRLLLLLN